MPRTKAPKLSSENSVVSDALKSLQIEQEDFKKFRADIDVITCKYSLEFPFWGVISERCTFSLTKTLVPTAGITATGHILFNVDFLEKLRQDHGKLYYKKVLFLVAHEISHFAFEHASRKGMRDHHIFNKACDYAINLLLHYQFEKSPEFFIEGGCLDEQYEGMSAESIYEKIKDEEKENEDSNDDDMKDFDDDAIGNGSVTGRERRVPMPDTSGKTKAEAQRIISDWVKAGTQEAYAVAKTQGKLPADFDRAIRKLLRPQIDWMAALRQKLRYGVSRVEKRDTSWSTPNRRFLGADFIFPSNVGPASPKIVYAVDTSGSMSETDLTQAMSELEDIRKKFQAQVYFIACDADLHSSKWIMPHEELPTLSGGGGTDFVPVFNHLIRERIRPDYCCFFTDGEGNFGDEKPPFETLWVLTSNVVPPFGEVVRVNVPYEG